MTLVRVFYGEVQNALVVDLQELREVFGNKQIFASLDPCRCQLYPHLDLPTARRLELSPGNTIIKT